MTDNIEIKSTSRNNMSLQPTTQANQETTTTTTTCYSNNVNADLSLNVAAAAAAASLDTTDVEKQETTYSQLSQQTETKRSRHDHRCDMPGLCTLEDKKVCSRQINDGQVPGAFQHLAATKVDNNGDLDSNEVGNVMDSVTKRDKTADIDCNKYAAIQHKQQQEDPLVLPASAADSVRQHYVLPLPMQQATASRTIANSAVNSTRQQSNAVNNASSAQTEDLMVAVPVEDNRIYAVSHDVSQDELHKRIQMVQARRYSCRLYFVVFLLVAAAVLIASLVVIMENKSDGREQETEMTTVLQNMTQLIVSIMGADAALLNDASSPYAKALAWLLQSYEGKKSIKMMSTLAQRFYAASFYFDTTTDDDKWTNCNPSTSLSVLGQTCFYLYWNITAQEWLSDSHECEWAGVECDNYQQIRGLVLGDMNLVGTISSSVVKFPFLQVLWLLSSQLEGSLSLLSNCHHLTSISIENNMLSGDLSSVWQHWKLTSLYVFNNQFTGSLSSQVGDLVDFKFLVLYNNELTGTVPSEVGLLDSIYDFDISNNNFRGELPSTMQFLSKIRRYYASGNSLTGSIPTFLGQLNKTLWSLDLRDNSFTGTLPDELFHLTELYSLYLSGNELSGTLDTRFAQLTSLLYNSTIYKLDLSGNRFTGTIPTELGLLTDLYSISLQGNDFTGSVPSSLCLTTYDDFTLSADCAEDDNGQSQVQCECCTTCCQADGAQCEAN